MPKASELSAQSPATVLALKKALNTSPSLGRTVVLLGDSYENANGPVTQSNNTDFGTTYFTIGNTLLGNPFRIIANLGVGGETCVQIAARVNTAIAYGPDRIIVGGSTNDDLSTAAKVTTSLTAMYGCYDAIRNAGIALTVSTRAAITGNSAAQVAGQHAYNAGVREYAQRYRCELFDMAATLTNPDTGKALLSGAYGMPENALGADAIHPSATGNISAGYAFYLAHLPLVQGNDLWTLPCGGNSTQTDLLYDATNGVFPRGNFIKNGKLLGTTGTKNTPFTGSLATNWTINTGGSVPATGGTGVVSKVAINGPFRRGEWQQIQIAPGATTEVGACEVYQEIVTTTFDGSQGLSIGDSIFAACRFETDATNWAGSDGLSRTSISLRIACLSSGFGNLATARTMPTTATNPLLRMASGVLRTPEIVIPANTAHIFVYFRLDGVGTVRFTDVHARRVNI